MSRDNALQDGQLLNGYKIIKKIGQGGFGITYLVQKNGNNYVLKELFMGAGGICSRAKSGKVIINNNETDRNAFSFAFDRFLDEAKILMKIEHHAIVKVMEYFTANSTAYYTMEYLKGESLKTYIGRVGPLSTDETISLIFPIFEAVKEMHKKGLWHRDIKPDNMMISGDRTVLIDFGAVKVTDEKIFSVNRDVSLFAATTPAFAAPEQSQNLAQGIKVDQTADIYALGGTLFYMITGTRAYMSVEQRIDLDSKTSSNHLEQLLNEKNIKDPFKETILKSMERHKEKRIQSVYSMQEILLRTVAISDNKEKTILDVRTPKEGYFAKNWYLVLPMISSATIAWILFSNGSMGGVLFAMIFVGIWIFSLTRNTKKIENNTNKSFRLLDVNNDSKFSLEKHKSYKVGRNSNCDIVISSEYSYVSREHLLLICSESNIHIRELRQTQGTYINGQKLLPNNDYIWEEGDELILGKNDCKYKWEYVS